MMPWLDGLDRYGGGRRRVTIEHDAAHVTLAVEGYEGGGETLLTPSQARGLAGLLEAQAIRADDSAKVQPPSEFSSLTDD